MIEYCNQDPELMRADVARINRYVLAEVLLNEHGTAQQGQEAASFVYDSKVFVPELSGWTPGYLQAINAYAGTGRPGVALSDDDRAAMRTLRRHFANMPYVARFCNGIKGCGARGLLVDSRAEDPLGSVYGDVIAEDAGLTFFWSRTTRRFKQSLDAVEAAYGQEFMPVVRHRESIIRCNTAAALGRFALGCEANGADEPGSFKMVYGLMHRGSFNMLQSLGVNLDVHASLEVDKDPVLAVLETAMNGQAVSRLDLAKVLTWPILLERSAGNTAVAALFTDNMTLDQAEVIWHKYHRTA